MTENYVVYWTTRYQDGTEDGAKVVTGLSAALAVAGRVVEGRDQTTVRVFRLGEEIPLEQTTEEIPQPPVVRKAVKLKG